MAVSKIIEKITIGDWKKTDIDSLNSCYLIAVKGDKQASDEIDPKDIIRISFEIGIDCGITNKPMTINRVNISFKDIISPNNELNNKVAFALLTNIPSEFYIRVIAIDDGKKQIEEGSVNISINTNPLKLG